MGAAFAMTLPGLVIALIVLALTERLWCRWSIARGKPPTRQPGSAAGFDLLSAQFSAGKQAELEHRRSERVLVVDDLQGEGSCRDPVDREHKIIRVRPSDLPSRGQPAATGGR